MTAALNPRRETAIEHIGNAEQILYGFRETREAQVPGTKGVVAAVLARLRLARREIAGGNINPQVHGSQYSGAARRFIEDEIRHLVRDKGYDLSRALGAAFTQARKKGLKVPPPPKDNPLLALVNPDDDELVTSVTDADRGRVMASAVYEIAYKHKDDGYDYEHKFEKWDQVRLRLLDDYRVLLFGDGVPIIGMFPEK